MAKEIVHYSLDKILKENANINLILGERSNGKSYQLKHRIAVEKYLKTGKRFILMRRLQEEIKPSRIEPYFADVDVRKLTDGKYNCITMYRQELYLSLYDVATHKSTRGDKIGYVVALSTEQHYAGGSYLDVEDIIFEEFISRGVYLSHEADKLMNFYCTIDRKRNVVKLWLAGNTISRICPYFQDWNIKELVYNQKQGTIVCDYQGTNTYEEDGTEIKVKIAIEYCESTGRSSFTIGNHKDMLNSGVWQTDPQPHLPYSIKEYKRLFKFGFQYQGFRFLCDYLMHKQNKNICWFIYPYKHEFDNKLLVFSDEIRESIYWQRDIYNPTIKNKKIIDLLKTFKENRIFYASDLCGTDFKQSIDFDIKK